MKTRRKQINTGVDKLALLSSCPHLVLSQQQGTPFVLLHVIDGNCQTGKSHLSSCPLLPHLLPYDSSDLRHRLRSSIWVLAEQIPLISGVDLPLCAVLALVDDDENRAHPVDARRLRRRNRLGGGARTVVLGSTTPVARHVKERGRRPSKWHNKKACWAGFTRKDPQCYLGIQRSDIL